MEKFDVTKNMIILDSESYASVRANNLSLDDLSEAVFGTIEILSISRDSWEEKKFVRNEIVTDVSELKSIEDSDEYYGSIPLESAKNHVANLFKISRNDLRYLLSKNELYFSLFNLVNYGFNLGYLLSNKWYNDKAIDGLDDIRPIKDYSVDVNSLTDYWNRSGELGDGYKDRKYLKHVTSKGIIIVLTTGVISNLMTRDKNTILYFYEDMLCELSKFVDKKVLYKTDLYLNYLNL